MKRTATRNRSFGKLCGLVAAGGAMTCAMFALGVVFAEPAHADVTGVYVGGSDRNIANGGTVNGASFDKSTQTLTLKNVDLSEVAERADVAARPAIGIEGGRFDEVTVKIQGKNVLDCQYGGIYSQSPLVFEGAGSLTADCPYESAIESETGLVFNSGTYNLTTMSNGYASICSKGKLTVNGGNFKIKAESSAFEGDSVQVKGGKLRLHAVRFAIEGGKARTNPKALVEVDGLLARGSTFNAGGNTYRVVDPYGLHDGEVTLVKFGSLKANAKVNKVYFGHDYAVTSIGGGAFARTKVESVTVGDNVKTIGSKAFYNCKQLKTLKFESERFLDASTIGSKAFKGAGAKKGKGLTVKIGWEPWNKAQTRAEFRTVLRHKGLSAKATVR